MRQFWQFKLLQFLSYLYFISEHPPIFLNTSIKIHHIYIYPLTRNYLKFENISTKKKKSYKNIKNIKMLKLLSLKKYIFFINII